MANPYPPNPGMQQMQPMQQPQMQQPMGQMPPPMQQPRGPSAPRQGTSRAVPVVVSAGLAVGVFCGLLFGVGTGSEEADASPSTSSSVKAETADPAPKPATFTPTPEATPKTTATPTVAATTPTTGTTTPTTGTTTPSTATTPTTGAGSAAPALRKAKLVVEVKPDAVAATAKISVDKKDVEGGTMEIEFPEGGKKEVKVVVVAAGYKTVEQKVDIEGDVTVKIELIKRAGGTSTPKRPPTGGGTKPKKPPGGGLIDI
ncbi:MAG: hypothetical protein JWP01_4106 [Myxococcales bacterium]|nr:hypothetical protein [Myxococcales bacterium]